MVGQVSLTRSPLFLWVSTIFSDSSRYICIPLVIQQIFLSLSQWRSNLNFLLLLAGCGFAAGGPVVWLLLGRHKQITIYPRQGTGNTQKEPFYPSLAGWRVKFLRVITEIWVRSYFQEHEQLRATVSLRRPFRPGGWKICPGIPYLSCV